ncbi:TniQ family protein [Stenotrophomonas sp. ATs4]|uniref:TniQ family protein n=1 Tax=Stenotrophomonas sp. ATs4 TaxID=3402766 RepID=UPI003F70004C
MLGKQSLKQSDPFPFHRGIRPVEGELLSSYLLRLAGGHCADPYRFYSHLLPGVQVWSRDIDRHPIPAITQLLHDRCGISADVIDSMSLQPIQRAIDGPLVPTAKCWGTWINRLGMFHRLRTLGGLQVCPICLSEAGVYLRLWRLSFVTSCPIHLVPLYACCPDCQAPIIPHRQLRGVNRCHRCHVDHVALCLRHVGGRPAPTGQQALVDALSGIPVPTLTGAISLADLARGVNLLRGWGMFRPPEQVRGHLVESQGPLLRWLYFDLVHELASQWPESMAQLRVVGRISTATFERARPPPWLECVGDQLRAPPLARKPVSRTSLAQWLKQLRLSKPAGWREKRAMALLKAAGK